MLSRFVARRTLSTFTQSSKWNIFHETAMKDDDPDLVYSYIHAYKWKMNEPDEEGRTPLHIAAFCGNNEVVTVLKIFGAQQTEDKYGYTPLDYAIDGGNEEGAEILKN